MISSSCEAGGAPVHVAAATSCGPRLVIDVPRIAIYRVQTLATPAIGPFPWVKAAGIRVAVPAAGRGALGTRAVTGYKPEEAGV